MATVVGRLRNGSLLIETEFNEVDQNKITVNQIGFYSEEFDEVTDIDVDLRFLNTTVQVSIEFDEITGYGELSTASILDIFGDDYDLQSSPGNYPGDVLDLNTTYLATFDAQT